MIIEGDCLEVLATMEDNSISAIVTDPPYGLSFMGKEWDHAAPGKEYWQECKRVLKPGGFLLAMGGTRTFHRLTCAIEDAGLEIRDCIMWLYGSGFPKSHNHFGIEGFGTALKPSWEPIIMAMKPCDSTFKQNAEKWGQAGINIEGCRIPTKDELGRVTSSDTLYEGGLKKEKGSRWPANLILDEEAAQMLDEQSGYLKSGAHKPLLRPKSNEVYGKFAHANINEFSANEGGASRFFYCPKASPSERNKGLEGRPLKEKKTLNDYLHSSVGRTASKSGAPMANNHPTVKPVSLMEYLIKLVMPKSGGILLDPFAGSGTTILAAKRLGFEAIGIEKDPNYFEIAQVRCAQELCNSLNP